MMAASAMEWWKRHQLLLLFLVLGGGGSELYLLVREVRNCWELRTILGIKDRDGWMEDRRLCYFVVKSEERTNPPPSG
jgi:hypothetical protein